MTRRQVPGWAITSSDQVVSSIGNATISILAARELSIEEFSRFGLVALITQFAIGAARAFLGEPTMIGLAGGQSCDSESWSAALVWGSLLSLPFGILLVLQVGITSLSVFVLGIGFVLSQDLYRFTAIGSHEGHRALRIDATWLLFQLLALRLMAISGVLVGTAERFLAAWMIGAALSLVAERRHALSMFRKPNLGALIMGTSARIEFVRVFLLASGVSQACLIVVPMLVGGGGIGAIRGVSVLFSPLSTLNAAVGLVVLKEVSGSEPNYRLLRGSNVFLTVVLGIWVAGLIVVPAAGESVLGATAEGAELMYAAIFTIHIGHQIYFSPTILAKAMGRPRLLRGPRTLSSVVSVGASIVFGFVFGAAGVALGVGAGIVIGGVSARSGIGSPSEAQRVGNE